MLKALRLSRNLAVVLALSLALTSCASLPGLYRIGGEGSVEYTRMSWCVPWGLKRVLRRVAHYYGDVTVTSTWRSYWHNKRVGGARKSMHRRCRAVDFKVDANMREVYKYVKAQPEVGGHSLYNGHIHIDNGPRRSW